MNENIYELTLMENEKGYNFTVFSSKAINSFVEYSDEEDIKKLRDLMEKPGRYKEKIPVLWSVKNDEVLKESQLELMSAEEVRRLVGVDFIACRQNSVMFHDSQESLLDELEEQLF